MSGTNRACPADLLTPAAQSVPDLQELQSRLATLQALYGVALHVITHIGDRALLPTILRQACTLLNARCGALYRIGVNGQCVLVAQSPDNGSQTEGSLDSAALARHVTTRRAPLVIDCRHDAQMRETFCGGGDCPMTIGIPLEWRGRPVGVIHLVDDRTNRRIDANDLWLLSMFADLATIALLQNERLGAGLRGTPDEDAQARTEALALAFQVIMHQSLQLHAAFAAAITVAERERTRIARDLHDSVRQSIFGVQLQLEAAHAAIQRSDLVEAERHLLAGQDTLSAADAEMGRIVYDLHPRALIEAGPAVAIREYATRWQRVTGIPVALDLAEPPGALSEQVATALYRIVQEALTNVARHARAQYVRVRLRTWPGWLELLVADDGRGGATARGGGIGIMSMRERASAVGAQFQILSPPGGGTQISVGLRVPTMEVGAPAGD